VTGALFWEGDTALAASAVPALAARLLGRRPPTDEGAGDDIDAACALGDWYALRRDHAAAARVLARSRSAGTASTSAWSSCLLAVEALLADAAHRADAAALLDTLDARLASVTAEGQNASAALIAARLFEARGDPRRALAALRRRPYRASAVTFLSTFLREEGRLAAVVGDTAGAVRAYRHYLALRPNPDAARKPEVDAVRAELAKLR
jgi:hypothetical protein